jgi:hypothetical protein
MPKSYSSQGYVLLRGALLSVMLAWTPTHAEPLTADSWERRVPLELHHCISIDGALIVPVAVGHQAYQLKVEKNFVP